MLSRILNKCSMNTNLDNEDVPEFKKTIIPDKPNMVNLDRVEDINHRISERNLPSSILQQQFSSRPISTKYSFMSILDGRAKPTVPIVHKQPYNIYSTFNPGSSSPFVGFSSKINDESRLRNQFFAVQNCEQSVYVPSSNSELYMVSLSNKNKQHQQPPQQQQPQPHPRLFEEQEINLFNPNPLNIGKNYFDNNTRIQLKDVSEQYSNKPHITSAINRKLEQ